MSQENKEIEEAIEILDKEEYLIHGEYKRTEGVEKAIAKLRSIKAPEQPKPSSEILVCPCGWYGDVDAQDALGSECGCCPDCGNEDLVWLSELQERIKAPEQYLPSELIKDNNFVCQNCHHIHEMGGYKVVKQPPEGEFTKLARKAVVCLSLAEADEKGNIKDEEGIESSIEILFRACDRLDTSEATRKDLLKVLENGLKDMENEAVQCSGEWEKGLFCGLEDRDITDRYEACMFGYQVALEKVQEWVLCGFEDVIAKAKKGGE